MEQVIKDNWEEILDILKQRGVSTPVITAWLKPLRLCAIKDGILYFLVNSDQRAIDFLIKKYLDMELLMAVQEFLYNHSYKEEFTSIQFVLSEDEVNHHANDTEINYVKNESIYKQYLNSKYTFDSFIVGDNNKFAHATAVAVAESPGEAYNPLFIYGGSGFGKTHLIQAIAHYALDKNPDSKVLYVTSENFTNELIESLKTNKMEEFRRTYRELDILIIDDIQFIINKDSTQEEFFHTFNTLREAKKQIILSSDRPPKELNGLPDRLINRFESGIIADIGTPNYEIRMAILKNICQTEHIEIDDSILNYISNNITSNIRELEGALNKLCVFKKLSNSDEPFDLAFAEDCLKDMIKPEKAHDITAPLIIDTVCEHFHITKEQITSSNRSKNIAKPRMIAMYLCRDLIPSMSLKTVGSYLGGKIHTTVMHGCEKVAQEMEEDPDFKNTVEIIKNKVSS